MPTDPQTHSMPALLRLSGWPFALGAAAVAMCYAAAGETLGFYLGPVMALTLILPILVAAQRRLGDSLIVAGAMVDAVGIAWLIALFASDLTLTQWLACYIALAAYAFALTALTRFFAVTSRPAQSAAPGRAVPPLISLILATAWLIWPVWTAPFLTTDLAAWLTPAHPLMAINRVVIDSGVWMQQPLMYRHASLGQDVPYVLPQSIWPCVIVHAVIGLLLLAPEAWRARARRSAAAAEPPAAPVG